MICGGATPNSFPGMSSSLLDQFEQGTTKEKLVANNNDRLQVPV